MVKCYLLGEYFYQLAPYQSYPHKPTLPDSLIHFPNLTLGGGDLLFTLFAIPKVIEGKTHLMYLG